MKVKFLLYVAAGVFALTVPICTSFASPIDTPPHNSVPLVFKGSDALNLAPPPGFLTDDSLGIVSGTLPLFTLHQKRDIVGFDFLMEQIEAGPHFAEVGTGVMLTFKSAP